MLRRFGKLVSGYSKRFLVIFGAGIVLLAGGSVFALSVAEKSGPTIEQHFLTQDTATAVPVTAGWHDIPTTTFTVTVPSGQKWIAHLTFDAESRCTDANWCSLRAVVTSSENGATSELVPAAGTNFAFDSGGQRGARSFSRITTLSGGSEGITYTFKIQGQITGGTSTSVFRLDDYLTQLELSKKSN